MIDTENPDFWKFIAKHRNEDAGSLMLKYRGVPLSFDLSSAVTQIDCRRRTAAKLKHFNECEQFFYPSKLAAEQSSNEEVARFHASLIDSNDKVADLTAGLGIDAICIAETAECVHTFELDAEKTNALIHNRRVLGISNLEVHSARNSIEWLKHSDVQFDVIFIDPARRDEDDRRTYGFDDCTPNIKECLPLLLKHCRRIIIKASPMLDMTQTERDLPGLQTLLAVSWRGECKEILAIVEKDYSGPVQFGAVMIDSKGNADKYFPTDVSTSPGKLPLDFSNCYLYEPDAAVLKLGSKAQLTGAFPGMAQCDTNTHVYISEQFYPTFPGRILRIEDCLKMGDKSLKRVKNFKRNIVCRNFPLKPQELKKRLKVADGGSDYIYGLTIEGNHRIILASPI